MKKKFQIILSISMFVILLSGSGVHTLISYKHIYDELVAQVIKDNRVIGNAVIKLLNKVENGSDEGSAEKFATSLQHMCNEILLPNKGFLCAVGADGFLLAAPGLKKGTRVDMAQTRLSGVNNKKIFLLKDIGSDFEGIYKPGAPGGSDIIVTMPIKSSGVKLMIHQNQGAVRDRALKQAKPLLLIGFAVSLLLAFGAFFMVNRLTNRYENKLEQSNRELTQLNDQRKELLHILDHDLTNPLNAILAAMEKLCPHLNTDHPSAQCSQLIYTSANHGLGVIQLVRRMQALEARKFTLDLKAVNLRSIAEMAYKIMERKFYDKKIQFSNRIPENLEVMAEKYSLCNTVLTNLLSNAVKFSPKGSDVTLNARREKESVILTITDCGIGIPPQILSRLFEITPDTIRPDSNGKMGTGFGMPLVKRLVEVHQGSISVQSFEQGDPSGQCGTTIEIILTIPRTLNGICPGDTLRVP